MYMVPSPSDNHTVCSVNLLKDFLKIIVTCKKVNLKSKSNLFHKVNSSLAFPFNMRTRQDTPCPQVIYIFPFKIIFQYMSIKRIHDMYTVLQYTLLQCNTQSRINRHSNKIYLYIQPYRDI